MGDDVDAKHTEMFYAGGLGFNAIQFAAGDLFDWKTMCRPRSNKHEHIFYSPDEYRSASFDRQAELAVEFLNSNSQSVNRLAAMGIPMTITLKADCMYSSKEPRSVMGLVRIPKCLTKTAARWGVGVNVLVYSSVPIE
jgi:hypothetical protein